jgi:hypothetical protein
VVVEEVGVFQDQLLRATQAFQAQDWPKAVQALDPLVTNLTQWERSGRLQAADEEILLQALDLRGACRVNLKDIPGAKEDYIRLVTLRPERPAGQAQAPKVRKLLDSVRQDLTGTAVLTVDPGDAALSVDGRNLGTGYPRALPVLKGLHKLRWTRSGYEPAARELNVEPGVEYPIDVQLTANAKTVYFLVQPEGTRLTLGKKLIATADKPSTSNEELARFCRENGVDPAITFVIAAVNLAPGEHKVTLSRDCYESKDFVVNVSVDRSRSVPGYTKPVILQRRSVAFKVTSSPTGASVAIDGRTVGITPMVLKDFCVGDHEFFLTKPGAGEYRAAVKVTESGPTSLAATLRPSLLWAGLTRDQETGQDLAKAYGDALLAGLAKLERFNCADSKELNPLLPDSFFDEGMGEEERRTSVESLCEAYRCQGLLAGKIRREKSASQLELRLFLPGISGYDTYTSTLKSPMESASGLQLLDARLVPEGAGFRWRVADLPGFPGPVVVRSAGDPSGPALGDLVISVGGKPVRNAAAVMKDLGDAEVVFRRGASTFGWTPGSSGPGPVVPYAGPSFGYRRAVLLYRQATQAGEEDVATLVARMNLCCALLNLGRAGEALETLAAVDPSRLPPDRAAALSYLRAVALARLGKTEAARDFALEAAADSAASLDGFGEIPVQPLARDLLNQLPTPPSPKLPPPGEPGRQTPSRESPKLPLPGEPRG